MARFSFFVPFLFQTTHSLFLLLFLLHLLKRNLITIQTRLDCPPSLASASRIVRQEFSNLLLQKMNGGTLMETAGIDRYRGTTVLGSAFLPLVSLSLLPTHAAWSSVQVEVDDYPNPIRHDDRPTTRSRTPGPSLPPNGNSTMSATKSKSTTKRSSSSSRHRKASTSARDYDEELIDVLQELRKAKTRRSADLLASLPFEVRVLDESAVAPADEFGIRRGASSGGSANESLARSGSSSTGTNSSEEGGRRRTLSSATSSSTHASAVQHPEPQPQPGHRRHRSQSQSHSLSNTRTGSGSDPRSTSSNSYGLPREREPPISTSLLLQQLTTLTTRLDHETSRAAWAEDRASEYLSKIKSLHTNQMQVQQELSVVRQELGLYKIQLELAQKGKALVFQIGDEVCSLGWFLRDSESPRDRQYRRPSTGAGRRGSHSAP